MGKIYSVNMLIALFTDFKEDGFRTLSESEVLEALQSLNAAQQHVQPTLPTGDGIACPICGEVNYCIHRDD
jgi:hypothetical protein